ncbi:unnamed protein product [Penicillium roqueforti FM164]|uniref:Genomic scaffold, ProqFM164S02 n=1 Tax=Penicillium roqueforti (strain FM164) TaxID=1365484 RepID=W6QKZ1_PENRF|nr:unnamed protein product [Penicillium roqueforti FM164]
MRRDLWEAIATTPAVFNWPNLQAPLGGQRDFQRDCMMEGMGRISTYIGSILLTSVEGVLCAEQT